MAAKARKKKDDTKEDKKEVNMRGLDSQRKRDGMSQTKSERTEMKRLQEKY